tara:strand:- start:498 stop:1139 length:642 start_codon:yes stop_codon:yes gene_type:complete
MNKRLFKDYRNIKKSPPNGIWIELSNENNIYNWDFVISGPKDTLFEDGLYWGKIEFPQEFPIKAPKVKMITPSGRFKTDEWICMSMTHFHQEEWNPSWNGSSILLGLQIFMNDIKNEGIGSLINISENEIKKFTLNSIKWNLNQENYKKLFPQIVCAKYNNCSTNGNHSIHIAEFNNKEKQKINRNSYYMSLEFVCFFCCILLCTVTFYVQSN